MIGKERLPKEGLVTSSPAGSLVGAEVTRRRTGTTGSGARLLTSSPTDAASEGRLLTSSPTGGLVTSSPTGGLVTSSPTGGLVTSSPARHPGHLPRLDPEFYRGDAAVHWTLTVFDRGCGWLNELFHSAFRELMLHAAAREQLFCPAYCLMPDHIHLLWLGLRRDTDQRNAMAFLRTHLEPRLAPHQFQPQAHDHVLRDEERQRGAFERICFYILANPVRAGLIRETGNWSYRGAVIPGYPTLQPLNENFWPKFWKLFQQQRLPEAGERKRPFRSTQRTQ